MKATEGNEATFRCLAAGFPRPTYAWLDPVSMSFSENKSNS